MLKPAPAHRLDPLLAPRSLALIGASPRAPSPGNDLVHMARGTGYEGAVYAINPKYSDVEGVPCFASLSELPEAPDHVAIALGDAGLEDALTSAIEAGARAATIFASGLDAGDADLPARLADIAREGGIEMCGINCMGFYNLDARLRVCGFSAPSDMEPGGIAFIAQSGSVWAALANNDRRPRFNICVSSGAETVTTTADYLEWALQQPSTRVALLFVESIRKPDVFEAALADAARRDIPVVVLKVGRTEASAAMAISHTGALAGNDGAYEALFREYGVIRVNTEDEMAAMAVLLQDGLRAAPGAFASMHDSGGEREMITDLAHDHGVPYAPLEPHTIERLRAHLDPGLTPENPLDAWGVARNQKKNFPVCVQALADDPNVGLTCHFINMRDDYYIIQNSVDAARAAGQSGKPVFVASNYSGVRHLKSSRELIDAGVPAIDGTEEALRGVLHLFAYRDFQARVRADIAPAPDAAVARWRTRLAQGGPLAEAEALDLLDDFGINSLRRVSVTTRNAAIAAAQDLGFPVVLKTEAPGIHHKSDVDGVHLGLRSADEVANIYDDLSARLGPQVLVSPMAASGVEIALGALIDPQFGACVMISTGGTLIEVLDDKVFVRAPVAADEAVRLIANLKIKKLLDGVRGAAPADMAALGQAVERFSVMVAALSDLLSEADVNPLIAAPGGTVAVDALIIPNTQVN